MFNRNLPEPYCPRALRQLAGCVGTAMLVLLYATAHAQTPAAAPAAVAAPQGEIKGTAWEHTPQSLALSVAQADLVLPPVAAGAAPRVMKFGALGSQAAFGTVAPRPLPVVLFLHGSSGLGLKAIGEWQQWLAQMGIASVAPDSFALPGHVTYKSPIAKDDYERIHALRASEIAPMLQALRTQTWVDASRIALAGTSEGAVPVARYAGSEFAARLLFAWSCEANYFVTAPRNAFEPGKPVLNVISSTDPFFSRSNAWLGNPEAQGHCSAALKDVPAARVALIPGAPHTLLNLPAARDVVSGFFLGLGWVAR